ncbi:MAG: hypothetical protein Q7U70_02800 [Methylotenera sp.]|nr:hypothetical protein [Methylotenera sp.]MDP2402451.1 hypothetical protein [Methylotenera sp.]MDZ4222342.1 hypothetical protein [Methylotenera sp.]
MSLLSVNQLLAVLGADNVSVVSRLRGLNNRVLDQQHVTFTQDADNLAWSRAANQLDGMLASMQVKSKAKLHITLASDFVRYLALPPQQVSMSSAEKLAYAAASYREVYGAVVDDWEIKLHDTPNHMVTIAAAADKKLLDVLKQIASKYQIKLVTVQPYLMTVFNSLSSQIAKTNGYLVIVEFKRLLLVNLHEGGCQNVRTYPLTNGWQIEFKNLMMRELVLADNNHRQILVYAPTQKNIAINAIDGWQVKRISTLKSVLKNYHFAMLEASV